MTYRVFHYLAWILLVFAVMGMAAAGGAHAQQLDPSGMGQRAQMGEKADDDPEKLRQSLDVVIATLENDEQRKALLEQLKTLRNNADAAGTGTTAGGNTSRGLLGALTDSLHEFGSRVETRDTAFDVWLGHFWAARADMRALFDTTTRSELWLGLFQIGIGLAAWLMLLLLLTRAGSTLFSRRGWPLKLPPEPGPWLLLTHFLRRILPALLAFVSLLVSLRLLDTSTAARAVVLVAAYATLCARLLTSIVDIVVSLFTSGHRRVAVALLHRNALKPLFTIGVLVAVSDAVGSERLTDLLGVSLATWLSETASLIAAGISGWLVLRVRRPVQHLIRNRPYAQRRIASGKRELILVIANLWHVPVLLVIGASILAIVLTGGGTQVAFARSIICAVLLVLALVLSGLLRRQREKTTRQLRKSRYVQRFSRFGYTLAHALVWLVFAELCAHVWGFSLLGIDGSDALSPRIGRAVMAVALTALLAWLVWIVIDTALERALSGGRRNKGKMTARTQTVEPMLRNTLFFTIVLIASIAVLANLGVNVTPLLAGAGIIGLAVGFGAQNLVQDLITGIFILVEDSLSVGDFVEINGHMGTVEGLNLRTVRLRDLDGILHFMTFSHISSIHNMSRQFGIALLKIRIPHDMPIEQAITLMRDTAAELRKGWRMGRLIRSGLEMQGIHAFEDGCPILRMRMRTAPEYQWDVARAFNLLLKKRMEEQFIHLGAPRLSVHMESAGAGEQDGGSDDTIDSPQNGPGRADPAPDTT